MNTKCTTAAASKAVAGNTVSSKSAGRRPTRKRGALMRRITSLAAVLVAVFTFYAVFSGSAFASSKQSCPPHQSSAAWTCLGGDPITPGGLAVYSGDGNARHGYIKLITSAKGATAMRYAGLNAKARRAFVLSARTGHFRGCLLKYGSHYLVMSFGINGTAVDRNVTFKDPRYRYHAARAFCAHVEVSKKTTIHRGKEVLVKTVINGDGSKDLYYDRVDTITTKVCYVDSLVPVKCGNFAEERHECISSVRFVHHRRTRHIPPPPKPAYACTNLSLSARTIQPGDTVTATVTYSVANGAVFDSVDYDWGVGETPTTNGGKSEQHTYNTAKAYKVTATVNFTLPNGDHVSATADACSKPLTVTPPPPFLTGSCKGFEEISGDGSFLVDCTASTNSGEPIYLNASSNDSYSYVSGINCYSNGGKQACPPTGGTFEFRVNGVNSGSNVVMSSVTVTITSGNLTWTQTYKFKVDPSVGGFAKHHTASREAAPVYGREESM